MREAERWREGYGCCWMEDETSICVCRGVVGLKCSHMHTCTHTHSWPALAWFWSVARGHGGHRSQLSACDGLIQTPPPPLRPDTPKPPRPCLNPSSPPPPSLSSSSAAGPCLVGMFERRRIEEGEPVSILIVACIGTCPPVTFTQPLCWLHIC